MSALTDRVYRALPAFAQDFAISAYGLKYRHERLGGGFGRGVEEFRRRDRCSPAEMRAYVDERLRRVLLDAFEQVPYYRERWHSAGLGISDLGRMTVERLHELPTTPKADLRRAPESFLAAGVKTPLHRYHTSGSTGTPITVICTAADHRRFLAAREVRSFGWAGASIRQPRSMIGGRMVVPSATARGRFYRYNYAERQIYFSAYHIRPDTAAAYVEALRRHRPAVFTGYAHCYYFLGRMMIEQGLRLDYQPRCLVLSGEKTTPEMKQVIERAFGGRAYEEYGSVENCILATECEAGRMHVSPDFGIVEIVDERGMPVPPGTPGRVVATGLVNETQPLIRYEIGDLASWASGTCPCGRNQLPVLAEVVGRLEDTLIGPDGRELIRIAGLYTNVPGVIEAQVVQEELDLLRLRVVAGSGFDAAARALMERRVRDRLGPVRVVVETVDAIERTTRGKFRSVVSHVERDSLRKAAAPARNV